MKLTKEQIEALELLAVKPRKTHRLQLDGYIAGTVASALIRRKLAKRKFNEFGYTFSIEITEDGKAELAAHRNKNHHGSL